MDDSSSKIGKSSRRMDGENVQRRTSNVELREEKLLVGSFYFVARHDEGDFGDGIVFAQEFAGGFDRDPGRLSDRVTVGAAADRGEGDSADVVLDSSA